jgi:hypothetical protein
MGRARLTLLAALLTSAMAALAPGASAKTETARLGNVTATFTFRGGGLEFRNLRLRIANGGAVLYDQPVTSRSCRAYCGPLETGPNQSALQVVDLGSPGQPAVVLSLFSEGAHCCVIDQVFSLDPTATSYVKSEHNFRDAGVRLADPRHNGRSVFFSTDSAFFRAFTSYAVSGAPLKVWSFDHHRFRDMTRRYPRLIARDARRWWRMFTHNYRDGEGMIAAWAADEYLLGHSGLVAQRLEAEAQLGHLNSDLPSAPTGQDFVSAVERFLVSHGYAG